MSTMSEKKVRDLSGTFHNMGTVVKEEIFGGFEQYIIDFGEEGIHKLRACDVEVVQSLSERLYSDEPDLKQFILRTKASLMFNDDLQTGSLARMRLDVIPHQMIMADKVLRTESKGFLIADDVGLGKTIETGLVIRSMIAHGRADRILLICPASLVFQWQEQLQARFNEWFSILNSEVRIKDPRKWDHNPRVIASIDTLKMQKHKEVLLDSTQEWDLVIVDEAHHLTAKEYGSKVSKTLNYKLLEELRNRAKFLLFLTATPHQGDDAAFAMLLRLLDPELISSSRDLHNIGEGLNGIMGRNIKSEVTDFKGDKLFKGHTIFRHEVEPSLAYHDFNSKLSRFVQEGLASLEGNGKGGYNAVGFLLTSFLKLSASSPEAIRRSLSNRHLNLKNGTTLKNKDKAYDERFEGEFEEKSSEKLKEIFQGEIDKIESLMLGLEDLDDPKLEELDMIMDVENITDDTSKRLLIFTEYRGTQDLIKRHLESKFGEGSVLLINGSMDVSEKRKSVRYFEKRKRFLVSTEAGGEGLDLHRNCHLMVNYDIPWNPMRMHQRTGRLDRYGQKNKVHVHYIVVKGTIDEKIQLFLEDKMDRITRALGNLKGDDQSDLIQDVLGDVNLSRDSISRMYLNDNDAKAELEKSIDKAVEIFWEQESVFKGIKGFNIDEFGGVSSKYSLEELEDLIRMYLASRGRRLIKEDDDIVHFELPDEIKDLKVFHGRRLTNSNIRGTFNRKRADKEDDRNIELLGTGNEYIDAMIDRSIKSDISGNVLASIISVDPKSELAGKKGLIASFMVSTSNQKGGKSSFDGVRFYFYDTSNDGIYNHDEDDISEILELLCEEKNHDIMEKCDLPEMEDIDSILNDLDRVARNRIYSGGLGSIQLNSVVWVDFPGKGD